MSVNKYNSSTSYALRYQSAVDEDDISSDSKHFANYQSLLVMCLYNHSLLTAHLTGDVTPPQHWPGISNTDQTLNQHLRNGLCDLKMPSLCCDS